jgi:Ala-tRNA(Pro) deacylase
MPARKLKEFLDDEKIHYEVLSHSPAYTAMEVAQSAHIPGKELAKVVMVELDGRMCMAVMPATRKLDLDRLREAANATDARLPGEDEFRKLFPECETGAMPPFGNLYGMEVYVSPQLAEDHEIAFNAGSHTEVIKLAYADYERLVQPKSAAITD